MPHSVNLPGAAPAARPADTTRETTVQFVCFTAAGRIFALPVGQVERVLRMVMVTPVPGAPEFSLGVISLHGEVVRVLSVRRRLFLPDREPDPEDRLMIVSAEGSRFALAVDEVTVLKTAAKDELSPPGPSEKGPVSAVLSSGGELILILDAPRLARDLGAYQPLVEAP